MFCSSSMDEQAIQLVTRQYYFSVLRVLLAASSLRVTTVNIPAPFVPAHFPILKEEKHERSASRLLQKRSTRIGSNCVPAHLRSSSTAWMGGRGAW